MGFVEETGVAQHYRNARINPIYEGTNGIQALDLVARKLPMDSGRVATELFDDIDNAAETALAGGDATKAMGVALKEASTRIRATTVTLMERLAGNPADAFAGATPYLTMLGELAGGWSMVLQANAAQARIANGDDDQRLAAKVATAGFYCDQLLPLAIGREGAVLATADVLTEFDAAFF